MFRHQAFCNMCVSRSQMQKVCFGEELLCGKWRNAAPKNLQEHFIKIETCLQSAKTAMKQPKVETAQH